MTFSALQGRQAPEQTVVITAQSPLDRPALGTQVEANLIVQCSVHNCLQMDSL